jgi:RNA polymerase sigma factor (sigma-70 family)
MALSGMEPSDVPYHSMNDPFDRTTITTLIKVHYSGLINLVGGLVRSKDLAADMVHQAIAITLEHIEAGRIGNTDQIPGYVYKTCQNLLRNYRRNMDNRPDLRADPEHLDNLPNAEQVDFSDEGRIKESVRLALRSLSSRDRDVVMRFYLHDEDKEVICRDLKLSSNSFNKIISRARQRLKDRLAMRGITGDDVLGIVLFAFASIHCGPSTH